MVENEEMDGIQMFLKEAAERGETLSDAQIEHLKKFGGRLKEGLELSDRIGALAASTVARLKALTDRIESGVATTSHYVLDNLVEIMVPIVIDCREDENDSTSYGFVFECSSGEKGRFRISISAPGGELEDSGSPVGVAAANQATQNNLQE